MIKYFAKYFRYLLVALLCSTGAIADTIYRTVDSNGRVSYSDKPPAPGTKNASSIELRGVNNSYAIPIPRAPYEPGLTGDDAGDNDGRTAYSSLVITYPAEDAQLRDNAGNVKIGSRLSPGLRGGDKVMLVLDLSLIHI